MNPFVRLLAVVALLTCAQTATAQDDSTATAESASAERASTPSSTIFSFSPSVGVSLQAASKSDEEAIDLQWNAGVQSRLSVEGEPFQFMSSLYAKYGQVVRNDEEPTKTEDALILTVRPSTTLSEALALRLFLEVTGETQMGKGEIGSSTARFLDPLFLYQTVFVGRKLTKATETSQLDLTYGVGYAFQQTIAHEYVLEGNRQFTIDENNPLKNVQDDVTLESGYSALFDLSYQSQLTKRLRFRASARAAGMTKKAAVQTLKDSRVSGLALAGLEFGILSIDYTTRVVYDPNLSVRRQLTQSLVLGMRADW